MRKRLVWLALMLFCFVWAGNSSADSNTILRAMKIQQKKTPIALKAKVIRPKKTMVVNDGYFHWKVVGADKYKGTRVDALKLLGYPEEVAIALADKVEKNIYDSIEIADGEVFDSMLFGKNKRQNNVLADWPDKKKKLPARKYSVIFNNTEYQLIWPLICGNWARKDVKIEPTPIPPPAEIKQEEKPVTVTETAKVVEEAFEPIEVVGPKPCELCWEDEPIAGAGLWANELANGYFWYAEYVKWLKECESEYAFGLGGYYSGGSGQAGISNDYHWREYRLGPQVGIKRYWFYKASDGKFRPQQLQLKVRGVYEYVKGRNIESGYSMNQNGLALGGYMEYTRQVNDDFQLVMTTEAWLSFSRSVNSTWAGDNGSNHSSIAFWAGGQYKINENWQVRAGGGPFYQEWDNLTGIHLGFEMRYKETIMFGPYLNFYPFGLSSTYKGLSDWSIFTVGGYFRIELGPWLREQDRKRRLRRIWKVEEGQTETISEIYNVSEIKPKEEDKASETKPIAEIKSQPVIEKMVVENSKVVATASIVIPVETEENSNGRVEIIGLQDNSERVQVVGL
jgi:hypothetical protein